MCYFQMLAPSHRCYSRAYTRHDTRLCCLHRTADIAWCTCSVIERRMPDHPQLSL